MANKKKEIKKLTPIEIHDKEFKKRGLSGYDRQEVDSFLDQVIDDYGDTLDQNVDLQNEVVYLRHQVLALQNELKQYQHNENATKEALGNAKVQAQRIINEATIQASDQVTQAKTDTNYERQQLETIKNDYDRVKKEVSGYRTYIQELLQKAIDNLNNDNWQKALDTYFGTERFYPPDGAEPITLTDEEEDVDVDDETGVEVDSKSDNEVNFDKGDNDTPSPMTGDSPSVETVKKQDTEPNNDGSKPVVIFPENYKNHK